MSTKNIMDRISICEALAKRYEIDQFLKWMVTEDEKWVTYYNIVRKRSWLKCGEAAQTVAKPGLTARKKEMNNFFKIRRSAALITYEHVDLMGIVHRERDQISCCR
ncbi:hypothetical protein TNCV_1706271 [Trichonephila clavipes]|nr:hypothetical protein TNCV_1706271 [Trichonephila clavipes]